VWNYGAKIIKSTHCVKKRSLATGRSKAFVKIENEQNFI
jgi:hypothetical protein